jgi:uncharacterized protein (TIGR03435 family)
MISLALVALLAVPVGASAPKAPEFKIAKVFNAPVTEVKSLDSLKGKVVFLEFWATWCTPCVAGVPRTNRLIESLKGEPVVFLAVTDEPADMIATFLKTHEFKSWVGVDEAKSSFKAFKNRSRPDGYLIGKDGTLLARIYPDSLKESDVRDAIADRFKPVAPRLSADDAEPASRTKAETTLFEVVISSASGKRTMRMSEDSLVANAMPFSLIVSWVWGVEQDQVIAEHLPVDSFNVRLMTPPGGFERGRELLRLAIESTFAVAVTPESKDTDVLLLALTAGPGALRPTAGDASIKSGVMASGGGRVLGKMTMADAAKALWNSSDVPVVDDTGLAGEYSLDLEWSMKDNADRDRVLAAHGLRLLPGRRKIQFLRVSPAAKK